MHYLSSCVSFQQPERINPKTGDAPYDIRSDVWSLGISMVSRHDLFVLSSLQFFWSIPCEALRREGPFNLPDPKLIYLENKLCHNCSN